VENVLVRKGKTWQEQVSFNFCCIAHRVRQRIPPRKMLHLRVKAVYDYFMDKTDSKTRKQLFNKIAGTWQVMCLRLSNPPGNSWYTPLLTTDGKAKIDKDGLHLGRCFRGTGYTGGSHGQFTRTFGHKQAGPMYYVYVLRNHQRMVNQLYVAGPNSSLLLVIK
jgi:hypothetical protein